jgi:histidinol-phosphate aminotransferase
MNDVPGLSPRPEIAATRPAYHGAFDYAELERLGLNPDDVIDFSVNSNPYGPSPMVRKAVASVPLDRYPDRESLGLRRALAEHLGISPAQILIGNGGAELLWLVSFTFLERGDRVLIIDPTFGEYNRLAALMGAQVNSCPAQSADGFEVKPEAVAQQLHYWRPQVVFLCNPNNPTGRYVPLEVIADWANAQPQTLFVIDEAYMAFRPETRSTFTLGLENILVLRSMTKDYALAGLRLGYVVGHNQAVIRALAQARPAWSVNALAQAAGIAAVRDQSYLKMCLSHLAQAKEMLMAGLQLHGLAPVPSVTHYFLMPVGQGATFRRALLEQRVLVRDCASFGLPAYVRIASRSVEENERLLAAIQVVNSGVLTQVEESSGSAISTKGG